MIKKLALVVACLGVLSCVSEDEDNNLAKAQECLDNVSQSSPESATECLSYIEDYDSQQANLLKCGIYMTSGGLIENKIVKAYKALKDSTITDKEAAYMSILSLDKANVTEGYTKAKSADVYCQKTGVSGLMYLSGIIVAGTYLNRAIESITGSAINIDDPSSVSSAVDQMLTNCTSGSPNSKCTDDLATIGTVISTLSSSYCSSTSSDKDVCDKIDSAVESSGGSSTNVGMALFCYLDKKTYNSSTNTCN